MILQNIARLCKQRATTIAALERSVGISNGTISRWGKSSPTVDNLKKVADFFGVSVDELVSSQNANCKQP